MQTTILKQKKLQQLEEAIIPYNEFWEEWIISKGCFLTRREIDVILLYRKHEKISSVADELKISDHRVYEILNHAINRLHWNKKLYRHWIADKMLELSGVYESMNTTSRFLNVPLFYHKLPNNLYHTLSPLGETLGDILSKYNKKELLQIRNFGKKKLKYLCEHLKKNNCLHLLRKD